MVNSKNFSKIKILPMPQKPTNVSIRLNGIQDFQSPCSEHPPKGEVLQYSVSNLTAFYSTNKRKCHNLIPYPN